MNFTDKKFTVWAHVIFWSVYFMLNMAVFTKFIPFNVVFFKTLVTCILHMIIVFINVFVLLPKFFFPRKFTMYFLTFIPLFGAIVFGLVLVDTVLFPKAHVMQNLGYIEYISSAIIGTLIVTSITAMLRFLQEWYIQKDREQSLLFNQLEADHKMLRMQVNPHFLFNALNNIYSLANRQSAATGPAILKLSNLMRFLLYEGNGEKIPVQREIEYIQNYIGLQALKFEDAASKIDFQIEGNTSIEIEPLLLIPFVENAFKHGNLEEENAFLKIEVIALDNSFIFKQSNSFNPEDKQKDSVGGVGLKNVKSRLEAFYCDNYALNIKKENHIYSVELSIQLL